MRVPILMADVIDSRKKEPKALIHKLRELVGVINKEHDRIQSPLTITLGDEFQGIVPSVSEGIQIIFEIEELILQNNSEIRLNYVLNLGEIETDINPKVAYEMMGEGLTLARESLAWLKKEDQRFLVLLGDDQQALQELLNKSLLIYQSFLDSWKPKDRVIVSEFLKNGDYRLVAEKVKIDKSNAWRRKRSLKIKEYETIKEIILTLSKNL